MRFSEEAGKEVVYYYFFFLSLLMFSASVSTCELRSPVFFFFGLCVLISELELFCRTTCSSSFLQLKQFFGGVFWRRFDFSIVLSHQNRATLLSLPLSPRFTSPHFFFFFFVSLVSTRCKQKHRNVFGLFPFWNVKEYFSKQVSFTVIRPWKNSRLWSRKCSPLILFNYFSTSTIKTNISSKW